MGTSELLMEIARCPQMQHCLTHADAEHPCFDVVTAQGSSTLDDHYLPQPWSGQLERSPILFLSPNPSLRPSVAYPTGDWSDAAIADYFHHRFDAPQGWIRRGTQPQLVDGTYGRSIRFWVEIRQRAMELLQREVMPGVDYALTHVVHCEAHNRAGVGRAEGRCADTYLYRVFEAAAAAIIVVLGKQARRVVQRRYGIDADRRVSDTIDIGDRPRRFVFLPHTNARGDRSCRKCLTPDELHLLRTALLNNISDEI